MTVTSTSVQRQPQKIWWSNAIFFVGIHLAAVAGVLVRLPWTVRKETLILTLIVWQSSSFGITIGYHRLYSHRAFRASLGARSVLAILGTMAMQGSIKWWCLRHRLHHRYTDDDEHDPYSATRGLLFSHVGWIFFKAKYERMDLIDRQDLERDPVVRFQHRYYMPLAIFFGFLLPPLLGLIWADAWGAFIWGGLVSRLLIWHCTFLVNSLAHWDGLQPYTDENTSRMNWILALLTAGEGNHNFHHSFPYDFRAGPSPMDWDPSKWVILILHWLGFVTGLRRARLDEIEDAKLFMRSKSHVTHHDGHSENNGEAEAAWSGPVWDVDQVMEYAENMGTKTAPCLMLVDGFVINATNYMKEHPGGAMVLRKYAIPKDKTKLEGGLWRDAGWAFAGGLNKHSRPAKRRLAEMRLARLEVE